MGLTAGDKLGPYEVISLIGKGGMGEVYSARDQRLNRDVAIKVSTAQFSERFEREARLIASLNHPNICTLHDVGPNYLVMEMIDGPTLAERISLGAIPWEEALGMVLQMVAALEAAHDKGIVHRDFKPGNIKIKPDGTIKVLDFGLAKAGGMPTAKPSEDSPTMSLAATEAGVILGTVAYMSPEQAKGRPVDKRADIWAFGVVLYEMLTAQRPFRGETISETLASVLREEPDWDLAPAKARRLIRTCLRKDSKQRLQDIADAKLLLEEPEATTPSLSVSPRRAALAWTVAAVSFLGAVTLGWIHFRESPPPIAEPTRLQIPLSVGSNVIALSPNGRRLAYAASGPDGRTVLWVREMSTVEPHLLAGSEGIETPFFWSPDSRFLAFQNKRKLQKVDAIGGPPQFLCDAPGAIVGGSWNQEGVILFGEPTSSQPGIKKLLMPGGTPTSVTNQADLFPSFLPDGRHFIYLRIGAPDISGIYLGSIDTKPEQQSTKRLVPTTLHAQYVRSEDPAKGYILFMSEGTLMAQIFDASRLELTGEPTPAAEHVGNFLLSALFSASENGVLAYRGGTGGVRRLSWFDREGKMLGFAGEPAPYNDVSLSPDGARVAVSKLNVGSTDIDIWVHEFARATDSRLTSTQGSDLAPVWSPSGDRIAFNRGVLYQKASSGTGPEQVLLQRAAFPTDWSHDGRFLLYMESDPKTGFDLWALPLTGEPKPMVVLNTPFNERMGQFSPDAHWIAYSSDESGKSEVYIQSFPPSPGGRRQQISQGGGDQPRWRKDGRELFFLSPDGDVMAVEISETLLARIPKSLFKVPVVQGDVAGPGAFHWDVTADGKKFLIDTNSEVAAEPATIVLNWMAGLSKK